jgi:type II secretory pathway component GspD/PulD (secretin)
LILALCHAVVGASERVRTENERLSIECRDASLTGILREIAAVVPMEVWIDEGAEDERVSLSLRGVTVKAAVEKLFESSKLNYALTADPADADKVAKIYVGSGGGVRLAPSVETEEELDPEQFLESPEAQDALRALKRFLEQQKDAVATSEGAESIEGVPSELEELLDSIPELPVPPEPATPWEKDGPKPEAKEKEKPPQL